MRLRRTIVAIAAASGLLVAAHAAPPVLAAWVDTEAGRSSVSAAVVPNPSRNGCTVGLLGLDVTYRWLAPTASPTPTGYVVGVRLQGTSTWSEATYGASIRQASTSGLLSNLLANRVYDVRLQSTIGGWRSSGVTGTATVGALGLITACTFPTP